MDHGFLAELRNEILYRVCVIFDKQYGESVPASLCETEASREDIFETIRRLEAFKADPDLIRLLETLRKTYAGEFGKCLSCGRTIESCRLLKNPTVKFCETCDTELRERRVGPAIGNSSPFQLC